MRHCIIYIVIIYLLSISIINHAQQTETLTIFAASSLTDAFTELKDMFMAQNPRVDVIFNFAGSSTLAAQIHAGAPADIFASANEMQMQTVVEDEYIQIDDIEIFATNLLVIALPIDNPANILTLEDLANEGVMLVLAVPDVPIREYTNTLLETLNNEFGDDYQERVLANLVSEEANVRQVVARIALGEADAGIVYQTDVIEKLGDQVMTIPIEDSRSPIATYPIAPLFDSPNHELAQAFIAFVLSDEGQRILHSYGFCSPAIMNDEVIAEVTPEATSEPIHDTDETATPCA